MSNIEEILVEKRDNVEPSFYLDPVAEEHFYKMYELLKKEHLYNEVDNALLTAYCDQYAVYLEARAIARADGPISLNAAGARVKNPASGLAESSLRVMEKIGGALGISPLGRSKLKPTSISAPKNKFSKFNKS